MEDSCGVCKPGPRVPCDHAAKLCRGEQSQTLLFCPAIPEGTFALQNHRMAWVGRDLKDCESPSPLPGRATNIPIY